MDAEQEYAIKVVRRLDSFLDIGEGKIFIRIEVEKTRVHQISQNLSNPLPTFIAYYYSAHQKTPKGFEVVFMNLDGLRDMKCKK